MLNTLAPQPKLEKLEMQRLPVVALKDLNLSDELYTQYTRAKQLMADAEFDEGVPLNQKAQTMNAIVGMIAAITKLRTELYNAERLKTLETTLIEVLKGYPEIQEAFIAAYEEALQRV